MGIASESQSRQLTQALDLQVFSCYFKNQLQVRADPLSLYWPYYSSFLAGGKFLLKPKGDSFLRITGAVGGQVLDQDWIISSSLDMDLPLQLFRGTKWYTQVKSWHSTSSLVWLWICVRRMRLRVLSHGFKAPQRLGYRITHGRFIVQSTHTW